MGSIVLNAGEKIIESVRANFGVQGGKLYLTNQRVVFKTNMGSETWGAYLKDLDSYYLQSAFGINTKLIIKTMGTENEFLVPKGAGTNFDECMSRAIQNLNKEKNERQTSQQNNSDKETGDKIDSNDNNGEDTEHEEIEHNHINYDQNNDNQTTQNAYTKSRGNYRWVIGIVCLAVGLFLASSDACKMANKVDSEDIEGNYEIEETNQINEDLVADDRFEAEEIAKSLFEQGSQIAQQQGNYGGEVLECTCVMTPENNPYGGYVVQVVLANGNTSYVKFDESGNYSEIDEQLQ